MTYGYDMVPILESRDRWLLSKILLDNFFGREPVSGGELSERDMKMITPLSLNCCTRLCLSITNRGRELRSTLAPF